MNIRSLIRQQGSHALNLLLAMLALAAFGAGVAQEADPDAGTTEASPYTQIVAAATAIDKGGVPVYQVDGDYFAEIPSAVLDIDLLWYAEIGASPPGASLALGALPTGTSLSEDDGRMVRLGVVHRSEPKLTLRVADQAWVEEVFA